jgi:hypothetical protein
MSNWGQLFQQPPRQQQQRQKQIETFMEKDVSVPIAQDQQTKNQYHMTLMVWAR